MHGTMKIEFEYEFKLTHLNQVVRSARPLPASVQYAVRNQIGQTLNGGVVEMSDSSYPNPSTIVVKDG